MGRRIVTSGIVSILGIGCVLLALRMAGKAQLKSTTGDLLVNAGTALLLFVPLFLLQRHLEIRVVRAEGASRAAETVARRIEGRVEQDLAELRRDFTAALAAQEAAQDEGINDISLDMRSVATNRALESAIRNKIISRNGIRVNPIAGASAILARLRPLDGDDVSITLERPNGKQIEALVWSAGQSRTQLMIQVAEALKRAAVFPGVGHFDPGLMFVELQNALRLAAETKERFAMVEDVGEILQFCKPQWVVCDWGIGVYTEDSGLMPYSIILEEIHQDKWYRQLREKQWVHYESFQRALEIARELEEAGILRVEPKD